MTYRLSVSSTEQKLQENYNTQDKHLKLRALTFKQNREIQQVLDIFDDSSDDGSSSDANLSKYKYNFILFIY